MWRRFIRGYFESFGRRRVLAVSAGKPQLSDGKRELRQSHSRTATPEVQRETDYANVCMNGHEWSVPSHSRIRIRSVSTGTLRHTHTCSASEPFSCWLLVSSTIKCFFFPFSRSLIPPRCWKWAVNLSNHPVIKAEFNRSQPVKQFSRLIVRSLETKLRNFLQITPLKMLLMNTLRVHFLSSVLRVRFGWLVIFILEG